MRTVGGMVLEVIVVLKWNEVVTFETQTLVDGGGREEMILIRSWTHR